MGNNSEKNKSIFGRWEEPYNRTIDIVCDLIFCMIGCTFFLGFGPFSFAVRIIIALVITGIFLIAPNLTMFVFAFLFFLCTAHINGAIAVVIGITVLLLIGSNHRQACLVLLTPMAFLAKVIFPVGADSVIYIILDCLPVTIWILFIVMAAKYKDFMPACFYSIYFGFMTIMTNSFGASIYGYAKARTWEVATFSDFNGFVESIFITKPEAWLLDYSFYGTICFVLLTMCAGIALYKVYEMKKHFEEFQNHWTFDGIKFMLFIPVLMLYFTVIQAIMGLEVQGYLYMTIIGTVIAFAVSRGFMVESLKVNKVDEQIHEMVASRMSSEDEARYMEEINKKETNEKSEE